MFTTTRQLELKPIVPKEGTKQTTSSTKFSSPKIALFELNAKEAQKVVSEMKGASMHEKVQRILDTKIKPAQGGVVIRDNVLRLPTLPKPKFEKKVKFANDVK